MNASLYKNVHHPLQQSFPWKWFFSLAYACQMRVYLEGMQQKENWKTKKIDLFPKTRLTSLLSSLPLWPSNSNIWFGSHSIFYIYTCYFKRYWLKLSKPVSFLSNNITSWAFIIVYYHTYEIKFDLWLQDWFFLKIQL